MHETGDRHLKDVRDDERPMPETHRRSHTRVPAGRLVVRMVSRLSSFISALEAIRTPALSSITLIWIKAAICRVV